MTDIRLRARSRQDLLWCLQGWSRLHIQGIRVKIKFIQDRSQESFCMILFVMTDIRLHARSRQDLIWCLQGWSKLSTRADTAKIYPGSHFNTIQSREFLWSTFSTWHMHRTRCMTQHRTRCITQALDAVALDAVYVRIRQPILLWVRVLWKIWICKERHVESIGFINDLGCQHLYDA